MSDFYMSMEALLVYGPPLAISTETIRLAVDELDATALVQLIQACLDYPDPNLYDHYAFHIAQRAEALSNQTSLNAMALILAHENNEDAHPMAIWTLRKLSPLDKVLPILRDALNDSYKGTYQAAAGAIFELVYRNNTADAIADEHAHVRFFAAAVAEKQDIVQTMLLAIHHEDIAIRRLAAWYCGRKKVQEAFGLLVEQAKIESDLEALQAKIWALGILRNQQAQKELELFLKHPEPIIIQTTKEALSKLAANS